MKVLIISDSHGLEDELNRIKLKHEKSVAYMIHCGDSELPIEHNSLKGFVTVRGNCDKELGFPNDSIIDINKIKLFATHGHLYNVKSTLMNIKFRADELLATIVCFGHTHIAGSELIDGKLYINPGSISLPRGRIERTYCLIEVEDNKIIVEFFDSNHNQVSELCHSYKL